ncbi:MAG: hypothetical protein AAF961_10760 [Planctomycetota bacterium]
MINDESLDVASRDNRLCGVGLQVCRRGYHNTDGWAPTTVGGTPGPGIVENRKVQAALFISSQIARMGRLGLILALLVAPLPTVAQRNASTADGEAAVARFPWWRDARFGMLTR